MEFKTRCPDAIHVARKGKRTSGKNFSINFAKNKCRCFTCGYASHDAEKTCARYKIVVPAGTVWGIARPREVSVTAALPQGFSVMFQASTLGRIAWQYLTEERHLSPGIIAAYNIGYCNSGQQMGRVVVPIYRSGELVSWVARDLLGTRQHKYISLGVEQGAASDAIFNLERVASKHRVLCVTEGVFDALRIPEYGVALLGKAAGERRQRLLAARPFACIIALDDDADREADDLRAALHGVVPLVLRHRPHHHDLGAAADDELAALQELCRACEPAGANHPAGTRPVSRPPVRRP